MKLFKSKKGFAPIVWGIVIAAGALGIGLTANTFTGGSATSSILSSIPWYAWLIIAFVIFGRR